MTKYQVTHASVSLMRRDFDSPESAAAAIADAMGWPGFCLGGWVRARNGQDACCVYASEADRTADVAAPYGRTVPRIWAVV